MSYSISEKRDVYHKVAERDVKIAEFSSACISQGEYAAFWNNTKALKSLINILKGFEKHIDEELKSRSKGETRK